VVSVPLCEVEVGVASTTGDPRREAKTEDVDIIHSSVKGTEENIGAIRL